jgi:hypothetical protein
MENEDNIINLANFYDGPYGGVPSRIATPQPTFNEFPDNKEIDVPEKLKDVVKKMCPEIKDIVSVGYREQSVYDPTTFNPIYKYLVGIDIYFDDYNGMKKSKDEYGKEFNDYLKMTYGSEMEFVSFHVQSFIFPPERTNKDKFFELFGKV